jgi:oligopeptidase B
LEDFYAWLKDDNWQEVMREPDALDSEIGAYLDAENDYTRACLAGTEALQEALFTELKGRIKEDDVSVPARDGSFEYFHRYDMGGQHPIFCRRGLDAGAEESVLLNGDLEARGHAYFDVADAEHSPDHRLFAYSVDLNGSEIYTILIRDLASGQLLAERLENAQGGFVWANDSATLFYTVLDDNHRPSRVFRHAVGTDSATDELVYEEPDPGFFVSVDATESRRFILIDAHDHETSEVRLIDSGNPAARPRLVASRERGVEYSVSHHCEELLILTNAQGAEDFKIVRAPLETPQREHWVDWVAHEAGVLILAFQVFEKFMARLERQDGLPRIVVTDMTTRAEHEIAFDEDAYSLGLEYLYEYDTDGLRYAYSSPATPRRIYDYHMVTRERVLRKEQIIPSGHDPGDYVCRRVFATSHDGERVPITLLHHKTTALDGKAPLLLYGYGAYGLSLPASFGTARLSLVDRGFVYAIAHVRGGMERGYHWYREGKGSHKKNSFLDFIAAAEYLVERGYTDAARIACHGESAGGLLVGVVLNMRPELFRAAVAEVPFVDALNTMCDDTLPLTPPEWPEWGNPIQSETAYRYIRSYSPYENVAAMQYPSLLVTAGLTDPRVTYWEPAKWVAKLRRCKTDNRLLLLKTNMEAGHSGAAGRFDRLEKTALVYAFLLLVFEML